MIYVYYTQINMKNQFETDVLICGAGATGLTLAIELARRNIAFQIIERLDSPFLGSRGKGIQPRTQEIFEDLGILDRIASVGGAYPPQREYRSDGRFEDSEVIEKPGWSSVLGLSRPTGISRWSNNGMMNGH